MAGSCMMHGVWRSTDGPWSCGHYHYQSHLRAAWRNGTFTAFTTLIICRWTALDVQTHTYNAEWILRRGRLRIWRLVSEMMLLLGVWSRRGDAIGLGQAFMKIGPSLFSRYLLGRLATFRSCLPHCGPSLQPWSCSKAAMGGFIFGYINLRDD